MITAPSERSLFQACLCESTDFLFFAMARTRESKEEILRRLASAIDSALSIVFVSVKGLTVHEIEALRKDLRAEQNECLVAKKTLLSRAFSEKGASVNFTGMEGEVAAIFGYADQVAPARILSTYAKQHEHLTMLAGLLKNDGSMQPLSGVALMTLAALPSRDELRAKVVGSLAAPLRNCVSVLQAPLRGFVQVMNAYAQTKT